MGFHFKPPNICGFIILFVWTLNAVPRFTASHLNRIYFNSSSHTKSWKEENLTFHNQLLYGTYFSTVRCLLEVDSFSAGFPQSWFFINCFCPLTEAWYLSGLFSLYATSLLPCKGYGVKIRTHLFFPKQDIQWTYKICSASRLLQPVCFHFFLHEMG